MTPYERLVELRATAETARRTAAGVFAQYLAMRQRGVTGVPLVRQLLLVGQAQTAADRAQAELEKAMDATIGALDPGVPLLLLPVRLETRYQDNLLKIRIFPDVDFDEHEHPLAPAEVEAGLAYWRDPTDAAWGRLVTQVGELRAEWVKLKLTPVNGVFPDPPTQDGRWTRPRRAVLLPDRWVAHAYRGGTRIATARGNLISRPLDLGPDPAARPDGPDNMQWMRDFETAVRMGMGLLLPLPDRERVDLLLVTGVRGTMTAAEDASALGTLLTAHRYHTGLSLVPHGTPTNNTEERRAGHTPDAPGRDADALAAAFGLPLDGLPLGGYDVEGQADLAAVLWPGTWGYYLTQLLRLDDFDHAGPRWRRWALDHVRPCGPLPALRVGDQPYGTLPVTSLRRWRPLSDRGNLVEVELYRPDPVSEPKLAIRVLGDLDKGSGWTYRKTLAHDLAAPADATGVAALVRGENLLVGFAGTLSWPIYRLRADGADQVGALAAPPTPPPTGLGLAFHGEDLVAVVQTPGAVRIHVGRSARPDGTVNGWDPPVDVTSVFAPGERILGAESASDHLVVLTAGGPVSVDPISGRPVPLNYRVTHGIGGTWSERRAVGSLEGENARLTAASAAFGLGRLHVSQFWTFDGLTAGTGQYHVGHELADGVPARWIGPFNASAGEDGGVFIGAATAFARRLPSRSHAVGPNTPAGWVNLLRALTTEWRAALPRVAQVRPGDRNPGRTVLDLLATDDVSASYQVRPFIGPMVRNVLHTVARQPSTAADAWESLQPLHERLGLRAPRIPLLGRGGFAEGALNVDRPFVVEPAPGWAEHPLPWLREMARATPAELHEGWSDPDTPLLAALVRHSLLQAYADAALALVPVPADPPPLPEPELVDLVDITQPDPIESTTPTSWRHLSTATLGGQPVTDLIYRAAHREQPPPEVLGVADCLAALSRLADRPAGEVARLAAGVLDAASHRLDAWITAVATDRLGALRAATPAGVHVGGYGFVRDLAPSDGTASTGYIHAPSPAHAVTAGVLRSGFLSHRDTTLAVDLSAARVRAALETLDAVREGRPLGAVLGARFERDLHQAGLAAHLPVFRRFAPLEVGVLTPMPDEVPVTAAAAFVTVDGLALLLRETELPWGTELPQPGSGPHRELTALLARLRDRADAIADIGMAESVHQTSQRNPMRAGGSLDALSRGEVPPPEPEVVRSPRTGIGVAHRVLVVTPPATATWSATEAQRALHHRAAAEPRLNAWAAQLLGDPARVRWRADGRELTLAEVGLCPLDVVAPGTGVVARLRRYAAGAEVTFDRADHWPAEVLSVPELLEIAASVRSVIGAGRAATAQDLSRASAPGTNDAEARGRAADAADALRDALNRFRDTGDDGPLACFGVADAEEAEERLRDAAAAEDPLSAIEAVFGPGFRALPLFTAEPPDGPPEGATADAIEDWIADMARVREPVGRLADLVLLSETCGGAPVTWHVGQQGSSPRWAALPGPATAGSVSIVCAGAPDSTAPLAMLVVDAWVEVVPAKTENTAVAFHFDAPDACAPQALLLAVSPDPLAPWEDDTLAEVVRETAELAEVRMVDPDLVPAMGHLLPALLLAQNVGGHPAGDTVSTPLRG
ncbi:hypothetical protein ABT061_43405 [Streptosporangium sp. NPDC002544]|uniref:hypothetical protein n=1 Tax=Streptosporangium sp. NPDC002544 TaxID=3154538 RepID=UPI0033219ABA